MKKVFIGGSRCINRLGAEVTQRIDRMVERDCTFLSEMQTALTRPCKPTSAIGNIRMW